MQSHLFSYLIVPLLVMVVVVASCAGAPEEPTPEPVVDDVEANKEFYVGVWDEILNQGNIDAIDANFAPDYVLVTPMLTVTGRDAAKEHYRGYLTAFSDISFTVEDIFGEGDRLVKQWVFEGTHTGELMGIAPTGKRVRLVGVTLARIIDGRIVEERDYADDLGFQQQLGVIPTTES